MKRIRSPSGEKNGSTQQPPVVNRLKTGAGVAVVLGGGVLLGIGVYVAKGVCSSTSGVCVGVFTAALVSSKTIPVGRGF
jgi:hypothetical protein